MRHWYSTEELTNYKKIWRKHRKLLLFLLLVMVGGVLVIFWPRKEIWKIKEGEKPINNPLKGWAQWGENIDDGKGKKLAYVSVYWSEVEPERGEFDFESLEELWNFQEWKSQKPE